MRSRFLNSESAYISVDMRFERIASTAGVRTHGKNEHFGFAASALILSCWDSPNPRYPILKILYELCGKPLDFIR
jgi:hypothetical protein